MDGYGVTSSGRHVARPYASGTPSPSDAPRGPLVSPDIIIRFNSTEIENVLKSYSDNPGVSATQVEVLYASLRVEVGRAKARFAQAQAEGHEALQIPRARYVALTYLACAEAVLDRIALEVDNLHAGGHRADARCHPGEANRAVDRAYLKHGIARAAYEAEPSTSTNDIEDLIARREIQEIQWLSSDALGALGAVWHAVPRVPLLIRDEMGFGDDAKSWLGDLDFTHHQHSGHALAILSLTACLAQSYTTDNHGQTVFSPDAAEKVQQMAHCHAHTAALLAAMPGVRRIIASVDSIENQTMVHFIEDVLALFDLGYELMQAHATIGQKVEWEVADGSTAPLEPRFSLEREEARTFLLRTPLYFSQEAALDVEQALTYIASLEERITEQLPPLRDSISKLAPSLLYATPQLEADLKALLEALEPRHVALFANLQLEQNLYSFATATASAHGAPRGTELDEYLDLVLSSDQPNVFQVLGARLLEPWRV